MKVEATDLVKIVAVTVLMAVAVVVASFNSTT